LEIIRAFFWTFQAGFTGEDLFTDTRFFCLEKTLIFRQMWNKMTKSL